MDLSAQLARSRFVIMRFPFRVGGRHIGASTAKGTSAGRRGVIGIRGDPERNKICRRQFCLPLWAEDRLTQ
jgi:hypothetical protein